MLREISNLRDALKTVERMKMEVENEKVAVQDQVRYETWMCAQHTHTHTCTHVHTHTHAHTHTHTHRKSTLYSFIECSQLLPHVRPRDSY